MLENISIAAVLPRVKSASWKFKSKSFKLKTRLVFFLFLEGICRYFTLSDHYALEQTVMIKQSLRTIWTILAAVEILEVVIMSEGNWAL